MTLLDESRRVVRIGLGGALATAALVLATACADDAGDSIARGDRLLGHGSVEAAIAEYRLARRQRGDDPEVLLRLAHSYAVLGQVESSLRLYDALLQEDSSYRYQAASDIVELGRQALERAGRERMARVLGPVAEMGIELLPPDLRLELAHHYSDLGEFEQALPLYLSLEEEAEPGARALYSTARAYEELGGCREALDYFERYFTETGETDTEVDGARWHFGSCLYDVARKDWRENRGEMALRNLNRLIELGVPRTLIDRAHYLRGELLLESGLHAEAMAAYEDVLRLNPARSTPLARMAEDRIREIRYRVTDDG